jgi:hypothetical protein
VINSKVHLKHLLPEPAGANRSHWKAAALGLALVVSAVSAAAQGWQFGFDLNGNLLAQSADALAPPQILAQPQPQLVEPGKSATFIVVPADVSGLAYQWRFNGTNLPGATSDTLLLTNVSSANEGPYSVVLANSSGSVTSLVTQLYMDSRGVGMPDSWQLAYFGNLNQNPTGDFDGDGVNNLQEFLDGTNPTNAASALYRITLFNDGGTVVAVPNQTSYTNGQMVTLTATGSAEAPFHAWTGDVVTRSNAILVTMNTNLTLFAHFQPFTINWTNTFSGDWNVASNWFPNLVPASNESVVIANQALTVTLNGNADLLDLTLGGNDNAPELDVAGRLTIAGTGIWEGGTMGGAGTTVVLPGASFTIISVATPTLNGGTLENAGTMSWMGGNLIINGGAITNDAGAQFAVESSGSFSFGGGAPRFDNAGTLVTATNDTTAFMGVAFNNYGTVTIQGGTFSMAGGGVQAGNMPVPAGTTVNFAGGIFSSSDNLSITGAGTFSVSGGTSTLGGTINVTGSNIFSNGSMDFTGNYTCVGDTVLDISGGTVSFDGTGVIAPNTVNLNGSLGGANVVTVGSVMNWTGGSMNGSGQTIIRPGATLNIAASTGYGGVYLIDRTLENAGSVVWGGGNLGLSGVITNDAGASFQILNTAMFNYQGNAPRFDNAGTFLPSSTGTTSFNGILFDNYGAINLTGGSGLYLSGGGTNSGPITVPAGATLNLGGGVFNAGAGSSITGAGSLQVSGATANLAGTVNVSGTNSFSNGTANLTGNYTCVGNTLLDISGGTVNFNGSGTVSPNQVNLDGALGGATTVTVGSLMNWTGGSMNGSGQTIIRPGATLNIAAFTGYGGVFLYDRTLENAGTVVWGGGNLGLSGVITNDPGASFQILNTAMFNYQGNTPRFDNAGTFTTAGSGVTAFNGVALNNFNTVGIPGGTLNASGGYVCSSNSILNCALWGSVPGATFGQLQASGTVNVKGSLNVYLTNYYVPKTNASFTVLTAASVSGAFANFTYPSNSVSMTLSNAPASEIVQVTRVSLQQTNSVPAPPGMISWWRGENNATDSVGTNNGAISNGVAYAAGEVGQSFLFDGSTGCVFIPDSASLRPASVTVEAWVKMLSTNGTQLVFAKPLGTGTLDSYGLALQNGVPLAAICDTSGFGVFLSDTNALTLGQWHHMAFTFDATTGLESLYTDGAMVASANAGKSMNFDNHPLLLGADNDNTLPDNFLNGQIDEASIYNRALTANEIGSIYNVGASGKQLVSPGQPVLNIEMITPASAQLYWSTNYSNYHLEYNTTLGSANWTAVLISPATVGSNNVVTNPIVGSQQFYRLSSP